MSEVIDSKEGNKRDWFKLFSLPAKLNSDANLVSIIVNVVNDAKIAIMAARLIAAEDVGADDILPEIEKSLRNDLNNENLLDDSRYDQLYSAIENWMPDICNNLNSLEDQNNAGSCGYVQQALLSVLPALRAEQRVNNYLNASKNYLNYIELKQKLQYDPVLKEKHEVITYLIASVSKSSSLSDDDKINKFHKLLKENQKILSLDSNDSGLLRFIKAIGVVAATFLGVGIGGYLAYGHFFGHYDKKGKDFISNTSNDPKPVSPLLRA